MMDTTGTGFDLLLSLAGTGLIYLLRWFWWRINAWSEISAMMGSFVVASGFFIANRNGADARSPSRSSPRSPFTVIWVAVALTPPTDRAVLHSFYSKVRPAGPGWRTVRAETGLPPAPIRSPARSWAGPAACSLFTPPFSGPASFLYGRTSIALFWSALFVASGFLLIRAPRKSLGKPALRRLPHSSPDCC